MTHRIVLSRSMDLAEGAAAAAAGLAPRHALWHIARALDATIHEPAGDDAAAAAPFDRVRAEVAGPVALWGLARRVANEAKPDDVIFCPSEAAGMQMAGVLAGRHRRPRLSLFVHNVDRPRARVALRWWSMARTVDLFLACSQSQVDFLRSELGIGEDRVRFVWDHTDTGFFTPAPADDPATRPRIVSVGLEQRDYRMLAEATHDLDLDVRISGFSKDAAILSETFPDPLPENMSRRFYSWIELRDLYRSAAAVVVACRENRYAAGVQSLMEGSACGRPIIATATRGLEAYLHEGIVRVPPHDVAAMRAAILRIVEVGNEADERAARNRSVALHRHGFDTFVADVAGHLAGLT